MNFFNCITEQVMIHTLKAKLLNLFSCLYVKTSILYPSSKLYENVLGMVYSPRIISSSREAVSVIIEVHSAHHIMKRNTDLRPYSTHRRQMGLHRLTVKKKILQITHAFPMD